MKNDVLWRYQAFDEECRHPDIGSYHTYGIEIVPPSPIHDVSTDRAFVEHMAGLFTAGQLSPLHFSDAVEDALNGS
ncbi:MAG: DUF6514 family protein [Oscillospiraceae bacterium]|jgi:hypothetical protein|nr:DUF6514 family protein [Oscillospiraceae bacterium]